MKAMRVSQTLRIHPCASRRWGLSILSQSAFVVGLSRPQQVFKQVHIVFFCLQF